ncbi:MAG: Photosynthesis system assembly factor [Frankiales bacterium]|nr:Photosynthesis system assembly factor [Frankiales bacterium]
MVTGYAARWNTLTAVSNLAPAGQLRLDAVTWADSDVGWLTGHGAQGAPMAVQTSDSGRTWNPLHLATGSAVAALAPCGVGQSWLLPVVNADGSIAVDRTADGGASWVVGSSLELPAGLAVWGCQGAEVWMLGHADHVFTSIDSGATWSDASKAPAGLTDLALTSPDAGFATSGTARHPALWAVSQGGARFARIGLPSWVSALGADMSTS